jgi:hypothetical protein
MLWQKWGKFLNFVRALMGKKMAHGLADDARGHNAA